MLIDTAELNRLIRAMKDGRMEEFDRFYELTKREIFYNIYAILSDYQLSEDILQETYLKFLESLERLDADGNPLGYLFAISRNLSLTLAGRRKREVACEELLEPSAATAPDRRSERDLLGKIKELLKPKEFQIVILHAVDGLTHQEIARLLKRPLGSVTWVYSNAIKKIRKGLGDNYG